MVFRTGIDIGSTTVKLVVCGLRERLVFSRYCRHHAQTVRTLAELLKEARQALGSCTLDLALTGSAGMGVAESFGFPFLQEVVASAKLIERRWPAVRTLIEIGGEDSKIAFFDDRFSPDIRMNGNCAGGTGAFIEQMAVLLNTPLADFDRLAAQSRTLYPIASRCGVFAKTDIQALLANHVAPADIAASVFHALALQVLTSLARGCDIREKVLFAGGPLTFFPHLREAFLRILRLDPVQAVQSCGHPELIAAEGAALCHGDTPYPIEIDTCLAILADPGPKVRKDAEKRLEPLFKDEGAFALWEERHGRHKVPTIALEQLGDRPCFLGIDSGSTTTKLLLMDDRQQVASTWYGSNGGDPLGAVRKGLDALSESCRHAGAVPRIVRTAVTGYGEDLIRAAFAFDDGVVETMAHFRAARRFVPEVSFILDIGGQDMKAITIRDGAVADIQINEACSSGCGSFIETFAHSLNYSVSDFARLACEAKGPFDLGTRCTVFMNSRVKQAFREGAGAGDISAGLACSVVKNSLHKVLKLKDPASLGKQIVVQGGLFRNPAVLRAFELLIGREAIRPDIAEVMGAYGAALTALENFLARPEAVTTFPGLAETKSMEKVAQSELACTGCENRCTVTRMQFPGGRNYFTGNRCESRFSNSGRSRRAGENLFATRLKLLFDRPLAPAGEPILTFGIPRALNMYENFPFWSALLTACGFRVVLSAPSGTELFERGVATVMSDSLCFPGQLVHGHIMDLLDKGVDRIFYPLVVFEGKEDPGSHNSFNCPIVTGYPDVVRSALDPEGRHGIPIDRPVVSFRDTGLLKKQLGHFLKPFGIGRRQVERAVEKGLAAQREVRAELQRRALVLMEKAEREKGFLCVVAGRPYHCDPLINHGLPELLAGFGVDVIPESAVLLAADQGLKGSEILTQWAYTNRILSVAKVAAHTPHLELLQITSFGCGLDAISADEVREIMRQGGKIHTLIKMDEIMNLGAVRIRLRSMLDAIGERKGRALPKKTDNPEARPGGGGKSERTVLVPWLSPLYSPFIPSVFASFGCSVELLAPQDRSSVEVGLKYVNNDMCYPAVIVIGDIIKALRSGKYDPARTTVLLTQTFGQCRASNYLPLARKALAAAGFPGVPIHSLSAEEPLVASGLAIDQRRLVKRLALGLIFSDALARMVLATAPHEICPGEAMALQRRYMAELGRLVGKGEFKPLLKLLQEAVAAFNALPVDEAEVPVVGVLGEIFIKYNAFSNNDIVEWLIGQGVEVVVPPLLSFFEQRFVNEEFDQKAYLKRSWRDLVMNRLLDRYVRFYLARVERVLAGFRYHRKNRDLSELALETSQAASLANQAGEGWLLPAEMIAMLKDGVRNIICLQPFGCLANQVIGKGIEKKLKSLYHQLNLLFLDMDPGSSEVNILNRLHFMVVSAREEALRTGPQ
ncbi:MAG: acyl-CoA dehydratase activase-related protein [Deltaproteobacteria bacterium]|nr:acyl-CoA dehydratase activase-related protein [Deltaproteobacteria bacterium]